MKISRRSLMGWMGMAGGAAVGSQLLRGGTLSDLVTSTVGELSIGARSPTRWEKSAQKKQEMTKDVAWLTHEPLEFLLRRGGHFDDEPEQYRLMCEPDNIKRMADAGVKYGRLFFYKGFGLDYEKPHIEKAKAVAEVMHRLGMKVSLYVGGTMFTETLYREVPEAKSWEQRDQFDHWVSYGAQTFRHYACPNEPAYRDYVKRALKIGVEEFHADELIFDNIQLQAEPKSCRCPRCMKAFTEFLRGRYPKNEDVARRFGLPDVESVHANEWDSAGQPDGLTVLNDPVLQEWTRFRCQTLANYSADLNDYVKSLNRDVVTMFNIKGIFSFNRYWTNAVYHPMYAGHLDALCFDTTGYDEHIDPNTGALISQIRSYKMARKLKCTCEDSLREELRAAVHMAFGYQDSNTKFVSTPFGSGAQAIFNPLMEFFREYNDRYYTDTQSVADVAVVHTWASMAYSISATYVPVMLMEQVLIQHKIPWDLLFDEQMDDLQKYGAVILAGQECISDAQVKALLYYVRNGGTLVLTGNTGQYNDWREERRVNPFLPARLEGNGRIVFIPEIISATEKESKSRAFSPDPEPGATPQRGIHMSPTQWVLPKNHQAIRDAIVGGLRNGLSISSDAPLTTVMEMLSRARTRETIAHFINFDGKTAAAPFGVNLRKQFAGQVKSVQCFSAEADDPISLPFADSEASVKFTVPATKLYAMIVAAQ